mgnify:CR=1 FL=1
MPDSAVTTHKVTLPSLQGTTARDTSPRSQVVLLQSLVSVVLGYEILFSPAALLARAVQEILVLGLLLLVAGAMMLPVRVVESRAFTIVLLLVDTTVASTVFYLSGDVGPDLYLAFFLIILISASTRTLNQKIGFSVLVTLGYGGILYLGVGQTRLLLEGHLLRIPILLVMGLFYGLMNETLQGERQEKAALLDYIAERKRAENRQAAQLAVSQVLAESATLSDAAPRLLQAVCDSVGWELGEIWRANREANVLRNEAIWHVPSVNLKEFVEISRKITFAPGVGLPGRVWAHGKSAWILDVVKDPNFLRASFAARSGLHGGFGFPIKIGSEICGVFEFFSREIREPDNALLQMMADIGIKIGQFMERKQVEEQLHQSNKLAALGTLLDGVAHELNNPLFMISGYTHLAAEKVKQEKYESLSEDLASIREATQRVSAIVERTMAVMRQAKGGKEPCEVTALLQRTLDLVANDLTMHQIEVRTHFQPDLPRVLADRQDLTQVFLNLFTNASQAMAAAHGRGTLTVTTALVESWVEIRVADDVPGIAQEHLSRIFDPFFTPKPVRQGMGLGLSIALRIVTDLRGTLTCESALGHGTTFIIRLPALSEVRQ